MKSKQETLRKANVLAGIYWRRKAAQKSGQPLTSPDKQKANTEPSKGT